MITINTAKGLIKVGDWKEITERPGFLESLNPAEHELQSILGRYVFSEKILCGLSNCRTPHTKGYIVATKSGRETNIGKDCGKNYFGVDYELMIKQFDRDITEAENRDLLWNFNFQIEELESKISAMRGGKTGADWVYKRSQVLINPGPRIPQEVVRRMSHMAKTKSNILYTQREATNQEIEDLEALHGKKIVRPHYIDEPIAEISGVEVLYSENDIRNLLVFGLEENIKIFKTKDIDRMTYEQLAFWKKWVVSVDVRLEAAAAATSMGLKLLRSDNLSPLLKILGTGQERELFREYLEVLNKDSVTQTD